MAELCDDGVKQPPKRKPNIEDAEKTERLLDETAEAILDKILGPRSTASRMELATINDANYIFRSHQMSPYPAVVENNVAGYPHAYRHLQPEPIAFLNGYNSWCRFHSIGTEMIISKLGRRMYPKLSASFTNLDLLASYTVYMDIVAVDNNRYKYRGRWITAGKAEGEDKQSCYVHPDSPRSGAYWMKNMVTFCKARITNNKQATSPQLVLTSMRKYVPRIHVVKNNGDHRVFQFKETAFFTVTKYQNQEITNITLKQNPTAILCRPPIQ
jgi:hypothetical protein